MCHAIARLLANLNKARRQRSCFLAGMDEQRDLLTDRILACAVALHRAVGPALKESVYHRGLEIEFETTGLSFVSKPRFPVVYREKILGEFFPDFIVNDQVIVEVKSASAFDRVFEAQMITYLRVTNLRRGLLLNFGRALMRDGIHRFVNDWRG
jgi:GxxExxY protein